MNILMRSSNRFENKHVLITGGARGIGFEIAKAFALEGAILTLLDNHQENLLAAKEDLKTEARQVETIPVDVTDVHRVRQAVEQAESYAPVDVLINNAGIAAETPFLEIQAEEWKKIIDVNLTGMFHVAQAVCRHMAQRERGVVVNMASKNGIDGEAGYAHYNASKGGVILLTKTMAL